MLPGDTASLRKARGAFFTPTPVARFLAGWAVRHPGDAVLEPSCGEAVFLHEIGRRGEHEGPLVGVEIHEESAAAAERSLRAGGVDVTIHERDFFVHNEFGTYDAVVGNPPYVRYQDFAGESRARARQAALRAGVSLSNLASSWAAFTVHSALHLKPGGRLGLVLPAELLSVNYASGVRQFLMDHFSSVGLVLFDERVFPGVLEEVVLLLADGFHPGGGSGATHMQLSQVRDAAALDGETLKRRWAPPANGAKWSAGLMSAAGLSAFDAIVGSDAFTSLETWGDTTLGMVTGSNRFFTLSPAKVEALGLAQSDVIALSPPGSRHLRGLGLTAHALHALGEVGRSTYLFRPATQPSKAGWHYIRSGEDLDVHSAYKCRVRNPWWRVPYLRPADLFLTYMNADTPRLTSNRARAHHLNSVHGVYLRDELRRDGMNLLPLASLNSVTLLGAETVGRAYGGGMLKIEPREADVLPVPSPDLVRGNAAQLRSARPAVARLLGEGRLLDAVAVVDEALLIGTSSLNRRALGAIRRDHAGLTARRVARGKANGGR
ncbi:N-6 DNA methylase [Mycolicibacterium sp. BiH015]|uniref:HsdM family class I SAM-dependent methyltransferase n=1 Tax=Mycolicibacterium sp. BiH015 TaxID=3018808 RepID=UPI0022E319E4|nr:N-6 DNA methylase [Mycolicibacterium sp. BiH015]MDA2889849.1 N-6 DNA methylase [Mycolicibacterium sp. BiH015]